MEIPKNPFEEGGANETSRFARLDEHNAHGASPEHIPKESEANRRAAVKRVREKLSTLPRVMPGESEKIESEKIPPNLSMASSENQVIVGTHTKEKSRFGSFVARLAAFAGVAGIGFFGGSELTKSEAKGEGTSPGKRATTYETNSKAVSKAESVSSNQTSEVFLEKTPEKIEASTLSRAGSGEKVGASISPPTAPQEFVYSQKLWTKDGGKEAPESNTSGQTNFVYDQKVWEPKTLEEKEVARKAAERLAGKEGYEKWGGLQSSPPPPTYVGGKMPRTEEPERSGAPSPERRIRRVPPQEYNRQSMSPREAKLHQKYDREPAPAVSRTITLGKDGKLRAR